MRTWCCAAVLLLAGLAARAAETTAPTDPATTPAGILVPRAVGVAPLEADRVRARDVALIDAQRNAIESGLGVMVTSETRVEEYQLVNDTIETEAVRGFTYDVEVLKEYDQQDMYVVEISCRVSTIGLVNTLADEFPDVYDALERPRIMILLAETNADGQSTTETQTALTAALRNRGVDVVEREQIEQLVDRDQAQQAAQGNAEAIGFLAAQLNAELMIYGSAEQNAQGATVNARVVNAWDARTVAAGIGRGANPEAAVRGLLPGPTVTDDLLCQMLGRWLAEPTVVTCLLARARLTQVNQLVRGLEGRSRPVRVELGQVTAEEASRIPVLGDVTMRNYNPRVTTIEVRTQLKRLPAIDMLEGVFGGLGYEITGINGLRLDLAPVQAPEQPAPAP